MVEVSLQFLSEFFVLRGGHVPDLFHWFLGSAQDLVEVGAADVLSYFCPLLFFALSFLFPGSAGSCWCTR